MENLSYVIVFGLDHLADSSRKCEKLLDVKLNFLLTIPMFKKNEYQR